MIFSALSTLSNAPYAAVNVMKGKLKATASTAAVPAVGTPEWDAASKFDSEKDKTTFRQYEDACERVKGFYKEQHGKRPFVL